MDHQEPETCFTFLLVLKLTLNYQSLKLFNSSVFSRTLHLSATSNYKCLDQKWIRPSKTEVVWFCFHLYDESIISTNSTFDKWPYACFKTSLGPPYIASPEHLPLRIDQLIHKEYCFLHRVVPEIKHKCRSFLRKTKLSKRLKSNTKFLWCHRP